LFLVLLGHRYRESGTSEWKTIPVTPSGSTTVTINNLTPSTLYEFQVIGKNALGEGMLSKVITVRTLGNETLHTQIVQLLKLYVTIKIYHLDKN